MVKRFLFGLCAVVAVTRAPNPLAQEREDRTLLSHDQMRAIVNEASGDRAMHHVLELVPYPRIRPIAEYHGHFRESEAMAGFAREYGFSSVEIESVIKAETLPGELETVHATIAGDGSSNQDVMVSGHLFEGDLKQGANDDNSGCALTLEVGRTYIKLVAQGKLPKPKRTIHFLWVPEISGTNAWLAAHPEIEKRLIADPVTYLRAREQAGVVRLVRP